jgi:hypothetical protein
MRFVSGYYLAQIALQDRSVPRKSKSSRLRRRPTTDQVSRSAS